MSVTIHWIVIITLFNFAFFHVATAVSVDNGHFDPVVVDDVVINRLRVQHKEQRRNLETIVPVIRINCGNTVGNVIESITGHVWQKDTYFLNGKKFTACAAAASAGVTMSNIDCTERCNSSFTYEIPVPEIGLYNVTLRMAENYFTTSNRRKFNVIAEGIQYITNLDIFNVTGGRYIPLSRSFTVNVMDGKLTLSAVASMNEAKINSIQVEKVQSITTLPVPTNAPVVATTTKAPTSSPITTIKLPTHKPTKSPTRTPISTKSPTIPLIVSKDPTSKPVATKAPTAPTSTQTTSTMQPIRINCGNIAGSVVEAGTEKTWEKDRFFLNGKMFSVCTTAAAAHLSKVDCSERSNKTLSYEIPVPETGLYSVTLRMSENYFTASNKRVFSVFLEGTEVITNLDLYNVTGGKFIPTTRSFIANVLDGSLTLVAIGSTNDAKINAIEINKVQSMATPTTPTGAAPVPVATTSKAPTSAPIMTSKSPTLKPIVTSKSPTLKPVVTPSAATLPSTPTVPSTPTFVQPTSTIQPIRINCGNNAGSVVETGTGKTWEKDRFFLNGKLFSVCTKAAAAHLSKVDCSERSNKTLTYDVPVPEPGFYNVTLRMAENYHTVSKKRVFNVSMDGVQVITNLDIYNVTGGRYIPMTRSFTVLILNGSLRLSAVASINDAKFNAIEVEKIHASTTPSAPAVAPVPIATTTKAPIIAPILTKSPTLKPITTSKSPTLKPITTSKSPTLKPVATPSAASVPSTPTSTSQPIRINCGNIAGSVVETITGKIWEKDRFFLNGKLFSVCTAAAAAHLSKVDCSERSNKTLTYDIPVPEPGFYNVTLRMAENYHTVSKKRVFNVSIDDVQVITNLDIYNVTGGRYIPMTRSFTVLILDGILRLTAVASINDAKFNAIEVEKIHASTTPSDRTGAPVPVATATKAPTIAPILTSAKSPTLKPLTTSKSPTLQPILTSKSPTLKPVATPSAASVPSTPTSTSQPIRINCGNIAGSVVETNTGKTWEKDRFFLNGKLFSVCTAAVAAHLSKVDCTERSNKTLTYDIPVPEPGFYKVTLRMAENYFTASKKRVFSVSAEGLQVITNLDIYNVTGGRYIPMTRSFTVQVPNGSLRLVAIASINDAKINAIEVDRASSLDAPTSSPTKAPTPPTPTPVAGPYDPLDGGKWVVTAENATNLSKRHESCFVMVDRVGVLLGGRGNKDPNIYNPRTRTWTVGASPPGKMLMHHMQCVAVDRKVWIIGGWTGSFPKETLMPFIYIYDPYANVWTNRTGMPLDRRRGATAAVAVGELIYVAFGNIGGHETSNHSESLAMMDVYNTTDGTWKVLANATYARDHAGAAALSDGRICVAGGRDGGTLGWPEVAPTECYNPSTDTWSIEANITETSGGASYGTSCDGRLLIAGGENYYKGTATRSFYAFDGVNWKQLPSLNYPRHGVGLGVDCVCNAIYLPTGATRAGGAFELTSVETYFLNGTDVPCTA